MFHTLSDTQKKKISFDPSFKTFARQGYRQNVFLLIAAVSVLRLLLGASIELGNDEAYYWLYTQKLQWNYFDHPPMVGLWGKFFTLNGILDQYELFVRLGSIVSAAFSTWFIFKATTVFHSERAGWFAAVLYNCSFYAGMVAGLLIMPDSPQMFFWTLSLWMLARISLDDSKWTNWILFGSAAGLCIMSKVHGAFIWLGLGSFILFQKRKWLFYPQLYISALVTIALALPILLWNIHYDFATYRFHSERVTITGGINFNTFFSELAGQLLFNNPVNVVLVIGALACRSHYIRSRPVLPALVFIGVPLVLVLVFVSLFRPIYPHWSGPGYVSLIPVTAIWLAETKRVQLFPKSLRWSLICLVIFSIAWPLAIRCYPGTWGSQHSADLGRGDVGLDRFGWQEGGELFSDYYREQVRKGVVPSNTPVVCDTWWGAHVEYYFCRPQQVTMIGLGTMKEVHHYLWMNAGRKDRVNMNTAFCIAPSDESMDVTTHYSQYYQQIKMVQTISVNRNGRPARRFFVYQLNGWKGNLAYLN